MLTGSCLCGARRLRGRRTARAHRALPLPDLPQDAWRGLLVGDGRAAGKIPLDPRPRAAGRLRILARQVPPLLHAMRLPPHGRAHGAARRPAAIGLPRHGRRAGSRRRSISGDRMPPPGTTRRRSSPRSRRASHEPAGRFGLPVLPRGRARGPGAGRARRRPRRHPAVHARPAPRLLRPAALSVCRHARPARLADGLGADRRDGLRAIARSRRRCASVRGPRQTIPPPRASSRERRSACSASTSPPAGATAPTAASPRSTTASPCGRARASATARNTSRRARPTPRVAARTDASRRSAASTTAARGADRRRPTRFFVASRSRPEHGRRAAGSTCRIAAAGRASSTCRATRSPSPTSAATASTTPWATFWAIRAPA